MRHCLFLSLLLCGLLCAAREKPRSGLSEHDLKLAQKSFQRAMDLQKDGRLEDAFTEASKASELWPANKEYMTVREVLRNRIAAGFIERGNLLAEIGDAKGAGAQFKQALAIDPQNGYAQERLQDMTPEDPEHAHVLQLLASVEDVDVKPKPGKQAFHVHGDTHALYDAIGRAFGVIVAYDQSVAPRQINFDVDGLDFYTALRLAEKLTHTFWAPVSRYQIIVANETQEMRRQYQRLSLETFYVANAPTPADLNDIANILRNVFEVRLTAVVPEKNIITVRAPKEQMAAISAMLDDMIQGRPEILLDIKAYEVSYDRQVQYGLTLPNNFQIFNVYAAIYSALGPAAQPIINQLKQTGSIDPSQIPVGSLSGLQGSPLLQPFIFFGKGWGLTAVTVQPISGTLSSNNSSLQNLEHVTLRASSGVPASMMVGTRFPIQLASFTNVSISQQGLPVVGNSFPQVQYEDLGLMFKATPRLQTDNNVSLELQLQIKGLGSQSLNGVPVITNREYSGSITVKDGEPSVVAGIIQEQVSRSGAGYPGVGQLPFLSGILSSNSKDRTRTEILIVITPHVVRKPIHQFDTTIWNTTQ